VTERRDRLRVGILASGEGTTLQSLIDACAGGPAILSVLRQADVHLVLLAGYAKMLGRQTLAAFNGRVLNTHPALLPKYGGRGMFGRNVHEAVLAAGESQTGVTIHEVDARYDHGRIVAQTTVPVLKGDDADTLRARVQETERHFVVQTLQTLLDRRGPGEILI
jgi:phosphoribosylglycinamide formyltransferase-1